MGHIHGISSPASFPLKAAVAVGTSALFMVVYSGTNWFTSLRSDVGTWRYEWEQYIPHLPLMVIPYMSIDLFFFAAPFLMRDRAEIRVFTRRIVLAIVAAGVFFVVMPLRLAVERPPLSGWIGATFGWFFQTDLPFNLCPSLHIALRTLLAETYARHSRGIANVASHLWFSLIGFSTLFTYQHHVVDVIGGFMLAVVCFYAIPAQPRSEAIVPNRRVGSLYFAISIVLSVAAIWGNAWVKWLLWPAASCAIVALSYWGLVPDVYRKRAGKLPLSTRLVHAPLLIGQYLSLLYYRRQCRPWDQVCPGIWIGRLLSEAEARYAISQGVTAVLDLTTEFSEADAFLAVDYLNVPILDLTAPSKDALRHAVEFITERAPHGVVYVHCKIGYSRSAAVAAAYLIACRKASSPEAATEHLRAIRPSIIIRPEAAKAIQHFAESLAS